MNKTLIARRFARSFATYDRQAQVQYAMAETLARATQKLAGDCFPLALEIGCGTGALTRHLLRQFRIQQLRVNDLVPAAGPWILKHLSDTCQFLPGDAEFLALPSADLIVGNAVFQWLSALGPFLEKLHAALRPDGVLAFSVFGPEQFREFSAVSGIGLTYPDLSSLVELCQKKFQVLAAFEEQRVLRFSSFFKVLRHMQALGVNSVGPHAWSRSQWAQMAGRYHEGFGDEQGLPLTYHPLYVILRRKA